jgi:hypothetical protein
MEADPRTLDAEQLEESLIADRQQLAALERYHASTLDSLKKTRRRGGAAAHKRSWVLEEQLERQSQRVSAVKLWVEALEAETDRRSEGADAGMRSIGKAEH